MKKSLIAATSLVAIAFVVPAAAQAQDAPLSGAYVNLGVGLADIEDADLWAVQGRVGYRFNNWVGVEGELATGLGSDKVTEQGIRAKAKLKHEAAAYLVGFAPVGANTDLLARVGYGTQKIKLSAGGVSVSGSDESFNFGVGVQHHFDGVNGVRFDYTRHEFDGSGDANVWSLAYSRRF